MAGRSRSSPADVADEQSTDLQEALAFFRIVLLVFAVIAVFVGASIIFKTSSIIVAQRSRELALLRIREPTSVDPVRRRRSCIVGSSPPYRRGRRAGNRRRAPALLGVGYPPALDLPAVQARNLVVAFVVGRLSR